MNSWGSEILRQNHLIPVWKRLEEKRGPGEWLFELIWNVKVIRAKFLTKIENEVQLTIIHSNMYDCHELYVIQYEFLMGILDLTFQNRPNSPWELLC